jgi:hypothetical protein
MRGIGLGRLLYGLIFSRRRVSAKGALTPGGRYFVGYWTLRVYDIVLSASDGKHYVVALEMKFFICLILSSLCYLGSR